MDLTARILIYEKDGRNLRPIKIYTDDSGRKWVEAREGTKFVIEVKNNSWTSILSVVSVDGLSVLTGKRAKIEPKDGYVVQSFSNIKINGWRTSLDNVREFVFTNNKKESYSHKLGADESNIGAIGFAFFKQKVIDLYSTTYTSGSSSDYVKWGIPPYTQNIEVNCCTTATRSNGLTSATSAYSTATSGADFSMGTKQGEAVADKAYKVDMEFEDTPFVTDVIYYDSMENLIKNGIIKQEKIGLPQPFDNTGFCPVV